MSEFFTMNLAAPIASFSAPRIDGLGGFLPIPTPSMIVGLIGAALGLRYSDHGSLQAMQDTLRMAVVVKRPGTLVVDYQTVDMGKPHMIGPMWWHDGQRLGVMNRAGGDPTRTVITERPLTCDYRATVVVELVDGAPFNAEEILQALREPAFPLSLGRRSCLPSEPVAGKKIEANTLEGAIETLVERQEATGTVYIPVEASVPRLGDLLASTPAGRNWRSRAHGGAATYRVRAA